jgi:hypothetical protein
MALKAGVDSASLSEMLHIRQWSFTARPAVNTEIGMAVGIVDEGCNEAPFL